MTMDDSTPYGRCYDHLWSLHSTYEVLTLQHGKIAASTQARNAIGCSRDPDSSDVDGEGEGEGEESTQDDDEGLAMRRVQARSGSIHLTSFGP